VGSEGTLAVFTKVALRLTERPLRFATLWAEFPSLSQAASAVAALTAAGLPLSVLEILDGQTYACAHEYVRGSPPEEASEGALLIELEGMGDEVERGIAAVSALAGESGARGLRRATDESERDEIWEIRRSISPALARLGEVKINEDIAVPRSAIPEFVRIMHEVSRDVRLPILAFGHAGDGNLHVNIMLEKAGADELARARSAVARLFSAALSMGGALSGEHGIGITKADHLASELSPVAMDVTKRLKSALDPTDLINPGKVVTSAPNPWWIPRRSADEGGVTC
jgi:glycolate oxidase